MPADLIGAVAALNAKSAQDARFNGPVAGANTLLALRAGAVAAGGAAANDLLALAGWVGAYAPQQPAPPPGSGGGGGGGGGDGGGGGGD